MDSNKTRLPLAVTAPSGSAGVSPPVSVLPEELAGHAPDQDRPAPSGISGYFEGAGQLFFNHLCGDPNNPLSAGIACSEAFRASFENAVQFFTDAAAAKGPMELVGLQLAFLSRQLANIALQTVELQRQLLKLYPRG